MFVLEALAGKDTPRKRKGTKEDLMGIFGMAGIPVHELTGGRP